MERLNVPVLPDDDFPQVICAQKHGEDFQTEYVEYVPRWNVDKHGQAVIVDKRTFFTLTDAVDRLQEHDARVAALAKWMYRVMDMSCAVRYPYEPSPVNMQALVRAEKELQALGIEVDG